jgi:AraC family transcriptional regulator
VSDASPKIPPYDLNTYVPAAITVVRRSQGWPGLFLQERRGGPGCVNYPGGIRQHVLYFFCEPFVSEVMIGDEIKEVRYAKHEARFTPAALPVNFRWKTSVHLLMLGFEPWFFERAAAELGCSQTPPVSTNFRKLPATHPVAALMGQLALELEPAAGGQFIADGMARAIAALLLREFTETPVVRAPEVAQPSAVLRAVDLMRKRLAESLTIEEIAATAGLSPFHFARQFKAATGHPPHEYLVRLRVDRAQDLLRQRGRSWNLAAVAHEVGFSDQSHLTRQFKRVLGITPREFIG